MTKHTVFCYECHQPLEINVSDVGLQLSCAYMVEGKSDKVFCETLAQVTSSLISLFGKDEEFPGGAYNLRRLAGSVPEAVFRILDNVDKMVHNLAKSNKAIAAGKCPPIAPSEPVPMHAIGMFINKETSSQRGGPAQAFIMRKKIRCPKKSLDQKFEPLSAARYSDAMTFGQYPFILAALGDYFASGGLRMCHSSMWFDSIGIPHPAELFNRDGLPMDFDLKRRYLDICEYLTIKDQSYPWAEHMSIDIDKYVELKLISEVSGWVPAVASRSMPLYTLVLKRTPVTSPDCDEPGRFELRRIVATFVAGGHADLFGETRLSIMAQVYMITLDPTPDLKILFELEQLLTRVAITLNLGFFAPNYICHRCALKEILLLPFDDLMAKAARK